MPRSEVSLVEDLSQNENVRWILNNSVGDINYKSTLPRLTDAELLFCLRNEYRKSGRERLEFLARKRGLLQKM